MAEHGAVVLRVCRAMLGQADADDAWAETFLAALKAYSEPAARQQRAGLAGDDRPPQGDRPDPVAGTAAAPGRRSPRDPVDDRRPRRSRHRAVGCAAGAAVEAARRRHLPPPGRNAVRRGRRSCWIPARPRHDAARRTASPASARATRRDRRHDEHERIHRPAGDRRPVRRRSPAATPSEGSTADSSTRPNATACSTSRTGRSTVRSDRCCWRRPRRDW